MRFTNFVRDVVAEEIKVQFNTVRYLAANINGGWEPWLQVQLFLRMSSSSSGIESFTREEKYPGLTIKSDFAFVPRNASSTKTWVELKVQCKNNFVDSAEDAASRFLDDIGKIDNNQVRTAVGSQGTVGAIAVIPVSPYSAVTYIRRNFRNLNKVSCLLVDGRSISQPKTLDRPPSESDVRDHALILYFIAKDN